MAMVKSAKVEKPDPGKSLAAFFKACAEASDDKALSPFFRACAKAVK
jgi:hypothetical protein